MATRAARNESLGSRRVTQPSKEEVTRQAVHEGLRYLGRQDRSQAQVQEYLARRDYAAAVVRGVVGQLKQLGYLDDVAFTARWVERRLRLKPMGRARMEVELHQQGIGESIIGQVLEAQYPLQAESSVAALLLRRRGLIPMGQDRVKALRLLQQYGFAEEIIEDLMGGERGDPYETAPRSRHLRRDRTV